MMSAVAIFSPFLCNRVDPIRMVKLVMVSFMHFRNLFTFGMRSKLTEVAIFTFPQWDGILESGIQWKYIVVQST